MDACLHALENCFVPTDYIAAGIKPVEPDWPHLKENTWQIPPEKMLFKKEHVERYSMELLRFLFSLIELNFIAWGESFAPTVCSLQSRWCSIEPMEERFVGSPYDWNQILSDQQVPTLLQDPAQQFKWFHAVESRKGNVL